VDGSRMVRACLSGEYPLGGAFTPACITDAEPHQ